MIWSLQLCLIKAYCQTGLIQGKLVDSLSAKGVPYAQVYNESSQTFAISDSLGQFRLKGRVNDTLAILSIGYYGRIWVVTEPQNNIILLTRQLYEIEPVIIKAPGTYNQFKKAFLEINPDTVMVIDGFSRYIPKPMTDLMDTNIIGTTAFAITHPIAYFYLNYSKEEKSKRKVLYLKQEEKEQVIIDQKYNRELIQKLTGLQGDEINDFIVFCNFTHKYLFEASDYEIVEAISQKFEEYKNSINEK